FVWNVIEEIIIESALCMHSQASAESCFNTPVFEHPPSPLMYVGFKVIHSLAHLESTCSDREEYCFEES
ncbi:hypothetical protein WA026_010156, partial [Henosepilachna vigintioctopunctata]